VLLVVLGDDLAEARQLRGPREWTSLWIASDGRAIRRRGSFEPFDHVMGPEEFVGRKGALALRFLLERARRRGVEARLSQLAPLARQGRSVAALIHESSTAITVLMTCLDELRSGLVDTSEPPHDPEALREPIVDAQVAARQLARMVNDVSLTTRAPGPIRAFRLADVVDTAVRMEASSLQGVRVDVDVPSFSVRGDRTRLCQVFLNLLRNAAQALVDTPEPQVSVTAERQGQAVRVHVRDNGPGLPDGGDEQVFDSWFTTRDEGTGLGLALCRRWMREQGGELRSVACARGAHFVVELRRVRAATTHAPTLVPLTAEADAHILVVDDVALLRRSVARALSSLGTVHTAASVDEAVAIIADGPRMEVVLTDLQLGEVDGMELITRLRRDHAERVGQIAVVTGQSSGEVAARLDELGIPRVHKPVGAMALRELVEQLLSRASM